MSLRVPRGDRGLLRRFTDRFRRQQQSTPERLAHQPPDQANVATSRRERRAQQRRWEQTTRTMPVNRRYMAMRRTFRGVLPPPAERERLAAASERQLRRNAEAAGRTDA